MELRIYYRMLKQGWWIIALVALLALNAALVAAYLDTPIYRASATYLVSPNPTQLDTYDLVRSLDTLDKRSIVATYVEIMNSNRILGNTLANLQLTPADIEGYSHSAVVLSGTNILELSVEGPNPEVAALLANSLGSTAVSEIGDVYKMYDISQLDAAMPSTVPVSPQPLRDGGVAMVLGLVVGALIVVMREQIATPFDSIRQRRMVDRASNAFTRRHFETVLENEVARSPDDILSLGLVRLDGLRDILDDLPPSVLQKLLAEVHKTLRKELRGGDVVGRWDDISFSVLLPSTSETAALRTMERICASLSKPMRADLNSDPLELMPVVGVVTRHQDESVVTLVDRLDGTTGKLGNLAPAGAR